jgi:hypothetical protein
VLNTLKLLVFPPSATPELGGPDTRATYRAAW